MRCAGRLNKVEAQRFHDDARGVPSVRTALERHLDFFDEDTADGRITIGENWRGWRRLGYGFFRSLIGTIGAAFIFGRIVNRFAIDIARIGEKRSHSSTGLYDHNGEVNEVVLAACMDEFRKTTPGGHVSQDKALEIVAERARPPGSVSIRQFKSLFDLCSRLNRNQKVITERQFEGLFNGYLLHLAGSIPDTKGQRRLLPRSGGLT